MATDSDSKDDLNKAKVQIDTEDGRVASTDAKNQENTVSSAAATAVDSVNLADARNETLDEGITAAGSEDDPTTRSNAEQISDEGSGAQSNENAQSNVIDSQAAIEEDEEANASASSSVGGQSVGGGKLDPAGVSAGSVEGNDMTPGVAGTAASGTSGAGGAIGQNTAEDDVSSRTTTEIFEVDVLDTDEDGLTPSLEDDFDSQTTSKVFEVQVDNVNDGPTVENLQFTMREDGTLLITAEALLLHCDDIDGDDISVISVRYDGPYGVLLPIPGTDDYRFSPNTHFNGDLNLHYEVTDGIETVSAAIDIYVDAVNDTPIISGPLAYSMDGDGHLRVSQAQLLANASDIEGDKLTAENLTIGENGHVTENEDGSFTIVPDPHFSGELSLVFDVSDGNAQTQQVMNIEVEAVADAPELTVTDNEGNNLGDTVIVIDPDNALELNIDAALVDQDLSEILTLTLDGVPEGSVVRFDGDSLLQEQDHGLQSFADTQVTVTFEGEGAGFKNSVGYYKVDEEGNIYDVEVVYGNASAQGSGGDLMPGESNFTFDINASESFNLFTIPNGARSIENLDYVPGEFVFRDDDGSPATMGSASPQLIFIDAKGDETVIKGQFGDAVFHGGNNIQLNADDIKHTRAEMNEDGEIIIGFEDLLNGGDKDFNDFTFSIDMGEVNQQIYGGEILVDETGSSAIPTTAISDTISIQLPEDYSGEFNVTVKATATELSNDDEASVIQKVHVDAREHAPESEAKETVIDEDGSYIFTLADFPFSDQNVADRLESITVLDLPNEGVMLLSEEPINEGQAISRVDIEEGLLSYQTEPDFHGEVSLTYTVSDGELSSSPQTFTIDVTPINDPVIAKDDRVERQEDSRTVFTAKELLANDFDADGDKQHIIEVIPGPNTHGEVYVNDHGNVVFVPEANYFGEAVFEYVAADERGSTDTANVTVNVTAENDPVIAKDDFGSAPKEPMIRLDELSEYGVMQYLDGVEWKEMEVGVEYSAHTQVQFITNTEEVREITRDIKIGSFDGNDDNSTFIGTVKTSDWGNVDGNRAVFETGDGAKITTSVSDGDLTVWNGEGHIGSGVGNATFNGLSGNEVLTVKIEAEDINQVTFALDGLGGYFDKDSGHATEVVITAYDIHGKVIDVQGDFRESRTEFDEYQFTTDRPVDHFTLGTEGGNGTYVVQSMTVSRTASDEVKMITIQGDGSEAHNIVHLELNYDNADTPLNLTDQLIDINDNIEINPFALLEDSEFTFSPQDLLRNDLDADGDALSIVDVRSIDDTHGEVIIDDNGQIVFTPDADYHGPASFEYTVTDGNGSFDTATVNVTVTPENDVVIAHDDYFGGGEDRAQLFTFDELLRNDFDVESDELTITQVQMINDNHGDVKMTDEGVFFTPAPDFNGMASFKYTVADEDGLEDTATVHVDVAAVNDAPNAPMLTLNGDEDQILVIDPKFITDQVPDIDNDDITLENLIIKHPDNATLQQQPDGMFHLLTPPDFNGLIELGYQVFDGTDSVEGSLNVDIIPVNDRPFTEGNAQLTTHEDGDFSFNADDLLNLFDDIDTEHLIVSRIITAEGEDGGELIDNGDGSWTFSPATNFAGTSDLQVIVSDGEFETTLDVPIYVRPVADGAVITTDHEGPLVFNEDSTGHLGLNMMMVDDSETLSHLIITGFPVGFEVSDGENTIFITEVGQVLNVTNWNVDDLALTPPDNFSGNFFLTVSATTVDYGDEASEPAPISTAETLVPSGDFETEVDEALLLTAAELLEMTDIIEAKDGDNVHMLSFTKPDQGEIVNNGDGTWLVRPSEGFTGELDLAYVVDQDGILHDAQSSIAVKGEGGDNQAPAIEAIVTTELEEGNTLSFTDADMLAQLSDRDELHIESVSLSWGQGLLEELLNGEYRFTPAEGFIGEAHIAFVASDGTQSIESYFNVNLVPPSESHPLRLSDDGSVLVSQEILAKELGLMSADLISGVAYAEEHGTIIDNGDGTHHFWPDAEFTGELNLEVSTIHEGGIDIQPLHFNVPIENQDVTETDVDDIELPVGGSDKLTDEATVSENMGVEQTAVESPDITAAPGAEISVPISAEIAHDDAVDHIIISSLPDGASVSGGLEQPDGSVMLTGDLLIPVKMNLGDNFEGVAEIHLQGFDGHDNAISEASVNVSLEVSEQYALDSSSRPDVEDIDKPTSEQRGDWTDSNNTHMDVDAMDDSTGFDADSQGVGASPTDIDDNLL
ncbi:tandem-95 repeat protein [Shewanella surugensis]|uniref:Tandem-95 repeat protein n=1 Tax=Shewanella surugensis TaxID=212020 RepID=A0ABT0L990_9GAMM|nr:tandem-95 repeat protein [Shewanella surugensis]MCL1124268.1 tandem-95 repeat protein [Shewanella surugensis]